jgi:hypothetical protein
MKRVINWFFVFAMLFSVAFIGESLTAQAQTQVTVKKKSSGGLVGKTYRGGRWVVRKTWNGTKYVSRKVWVGTKYGTRKTVQGTKYVGKKTWKGTKKVGSTTKKILVGN